VSTEPKRYLDRSGPLSSFADKAIAVCPNCKGPALVKSPSRYYFPFVPKNARVHCLRCSFARKSSDSDWFGPATSIERKRCPSCGFKWLRAVRHRGHLNAKRRQTIEAECPTCHKRTTLPICWVEEPFSGDAIDPAFGLPLWLQTRCSGHTLWAYNRRHLSELQGYVAATLRERVANGKWTMFARLPHWVKSAKNRDAVLRCLSRLESSLAAVEQIAAV